MLFFFSSQIHSKKVQTEEDELTHVNHYHLSLRLISSVMEWMNTPSAKLQNQTTQKIARPLLFCCGIFFKITLKCYYKANFLKEMILQLGFQA